MVGMSHEILPFINDKKYSDKMKNIVQVTILSIAETPEQLKLA